MYVSNYLYHNNLSIHLVRTSIKDEIKKNNELLIQCLKKKE